MILTCGKCVGFVDGKCQHLDYLTGYSDGQERELKVLERWIEQLKAEQEANTGALWCIRELEAYVRSRRAIEVIEQIWAVWFKGDEESEPGVCSRNGHVLLFNGDLAKADAKAALAEYLDGHYLDGSSLDPKEFGVRKVELTIRPVDDDG
jgi:hypothetical protein